MTKIIKKIIGFILAIPLWLLLIAAVPIVWIIVPFFFESIIMCIFAIGPAIIDLLLLKYVTYVPHDLFARYFGIALGAIIGLSTHIIALLCALITNYYFSRTKELCANADTADFSNGYSEDDDEDDDEDEGWEDEDDEDYEDDSAAEPEKVEEIHSIETEENANVYSENVQSSQIEQEEESFEPKEESLSFNNRLRKYILIPLYWTFLATLSCAVCGYFTGFIIDSRYASHFFTNNNSLLCNAPFNFMLIFVSSNNMTAISEEFQFAIFLDAAFIIEFLALYRFYIMSNSKRFSGWRVYMIFVYFLLPIILTSLATWYYCQPSIPYKERELTPGVYLYTNDTAYNVTGVNIYSSRCGGFAHSGFFLITKDPKAENAQRRKDGLKDLKFIKLQRGYYVNMISMAVPDVDGFTNYQSRCYPQENAYDFDTEALKNYLAGHSPNDLPAPAVRLIHVPVTDVHKAWNRIDEFKQTFNKRFPDGMIYSPVPYTDEHVKTINCNTYSAAVIDTLDKEKLIDKSNQKNICQFEKLINRFGNFGRQKLSDGQRLNEFLAQDDAPDQIKRQWEFVKTTPLSEQNFWANVLRPDGSYGKRLSKLVNKPKD